MYWPLFDSATLTNMLVAGLISLVVAWLTALFVARSDRKMQQEAWVREDKIRRADQSSAHLDDFFSRLDASAQGSETENFEKRLLALEAKVSLLLRESKK